MTVQELSRRLDLASHSGTEVSLSLVGINSLTQMYRFRVVGAAKANEVLIWGKKKEAQELLECGFIKYALSTYRRLR